MPGSAHRLQLNPQQEFTMKPFDVVSIPPRVVRQARGGSVGPSASRKTLSLPVRDTACARFFFHLMRSRRCPRLLGDTRAWEAVLGAELQLATCSAQPPPSHIQPAPCPSTIRWVLLCCANVCTEHKHRSHAGLPYLLGRLPPVFSRSDPMI